MFKMHLPHNQAIPFLTIYSKAVFFFEAVIHYLLVDYEDNVRDTTSIFLILT